MENGIKNLLGLGYFLLRSQKSLKFAISLHISCYIQVAILMVDPPSWQSRHVEVEHLISLIVEWQLKDT